MSEFVLAVIAVCVGVAAYQISKIAILLEAGLKLLALVYDDILKEEEK